jgi:hypothetical protein
MTLARWSSDNGDRVVAILRRELLAPLPEDVGAAHLEAMLLERDWERPPEPADRPRSRTRTIVGSCVVAAALSLTSGFAVAGALPATAQHWISRATRFVGIPLPDAPAHRPAPAPRHPSARPAPTPARRVAKPRPRPAEGTRRPAHARVPTTGASPRGEGNSDGSDAVGNAGTARDRAPKSERGNGKAKNKAAVTASGLSGKSGKVASQPKSKSKSKKDGQSGV